MKCPRCGLEMTLLYQFYTCYPCKDGQCDISSLREFYVIVRKDVLTAFVANGGAITQKVYKAARSFDDAMWFVSQVTPDASKYAALRARRTYTDVDIPPGVAKRYDDTHTLLSTEFFLRKDWSQYVPDERHYPFCLTTSDEDIEDALADRP